MVTTSRADYGHLYWVLKALESDPRVTLQLVVAGSHFSKRHGSSYRRIIADGFRPAAVVRTTVVADTDAAAAAAVGRLTIGLGNVFADLRPDLMVILGDRYELLGAAAVATVFRVPIAHLHGGESTAGAIDDNVRHALSKLSHVHLVAAKPYAARLRRMGEERRRIYVVGAPGLDHLRRTRLPNSDAVMETLRIPVADPRPLLLVTFHPATLHRGTAGRDATALARALATLPARIVVTAPGADPEYRSVVAALRRRAHRGSTVRFVADLGTAAYWSLMAVADAVVGNSSSGIIEAPSFGTPVVNIGDRQDGRLRAANVIDVPLAADAIARGLRRALTPTFRRRARRAKNPYGGPGASDRIATLLATLPLDERLRQKRIV